MPLIIVLSSILAFGIGRATKQAHETVVVEKLDGTVEVREAKASEADYVVKRDYWGTVASVEERHK